MRTIQDIQKDIDNIKEKITDVLHSRENTNSNGDLNKKLKLLDKLRREDYILRMHIRDAKERLSKLKLDIIHNREHIHREIQEIKESINKNEQKKEKEHRDKKYKYI